LIDLLDLDDDDFSPDAVAAAKKFNLLRLLPRDVRLKPSGQDRYMTNCMFHDDSTPSMSIFKCDDGTWRYKCFGCGEGGDPITMLQRENNMSFRDAVVALHKASNEVKAQPKEVETYSYRDEEGQELYQVVRYDPKGFRQRKRQSDGRFCWSMQGVRRVPYRLPGLLGMAPDTTVFYVEGEKDCHTLESLGLIATTHAGGANAWRTEYAMYFYGLHVTVIPDQDEPGLKMAAAAIHDLKEMAASVRRIDLSFGKDVTEYLEKGGKLMDMLMLSVPA
jgi:DNA primase